MASSTKRRCGNAACTCNSTFATKRLCQPSAAERVRGYRDDRGWTQAQAAKWWGCSEREWRRWEKGDATPPTALLMRIAKFKKPD